MVRSLRKRHQFFWLIIAVLLPINFALAVYLIPPFPFQNRIDTEIPDALPLIIREIDHENYKLNLRSDDHENYQVELFIKKPLKSPAPALFLDKKGNNKISDSDFIGNLGSRGLYRFSLPNPKDAKGVFVYCNIAQHPVEIISLEK